MTFDEIRIIDKHTGASKYLVGNDNQIKDLLRQHEADEEGFCIHCHQAINHNNEGDICEQR